MRKHYFLWILLMILCSSAFGQNKFLPFTKSNQYSVDALQTIKPSRTLESMRSGYLQVTYNFPGAMLAEKAEKGEMYNFLHIDQFGKLGQVGAPALPMRNDMIAVSKNILPSVELIDVEYVDYEGYNIHPALELPMDTQGAPSPEFEKDASVYEKDAFFPDNVVSVISDQIMKDARMLRVQVCPVQFNPVTKTLRVYSKMVYQIHTGTDKTRVNTTTDNLNILKQMVLNPEDVQQETRSLQMDAEGDNASKDYIIITNSMFDHAAKKLASWKASLGYKVEIVSRDSWTTDKVKEAIHSRYHNWIPKPSYYVIIGDNEQVPSMDFKTYKDEPFVSDLYYSCMDGADDYTPDIARGRISVATVEQSETVIDKIINYEKNPVVDDKFYKTGLNCAQFQDVAKDEAPDGYAARRFCHTSEDIRNYVVGQGYDVERIYYTDAANTPTHFNNELFSNGEALPAELLRENGFNWDGGATEITNSVNDGRFYLFHRDHGYAGGLGWAHPRFVTSEIDGLHNGNKLPVVFSINCHTGEFSLPECFSEKFLRKKNGGAVAVFGASYYSYSGPNDGFSLGMVEAIWPNPGITPSFGNGAGVTNPGPSDFENSVTSLGDVLNMGLMRMDQTWAPNADDRLYTYQLFHLFGDPAMKMWTQAPIAMTADMPASVECGATSLTVSNISNPNAIVTVVQGDKLLAKANVLAGKAEINFAAVDNSDKLVVTVSATKHRPVVKEYVVAGCVDKPVASFSVSRSTTLLGENNRVITFFDNSDNTPTSWLWDFGTTDLEFEDETSATSQNPVVKFLVKGIYDIKLTATNKNGDSECIKKNAITVCEDALSATCFGQTTNLENNYGMGIKGFSLNSIASSSGDAVEDGGYQDYSASRYTTLVPGKTYKSSVVVGDVNPQNVKIYLDKNNDGVFDDGEEIVSLEKFTGEKRFDFSVPYDSELNKMLRLRVISAYWKYTITDACYASTYGQTEDYAVVVKAGPAVVETLEPVERGFDFAKLKAMLISDGRGTVLERGIVLANHELPSIADTKVVDPDMSVDEYVLTFNGLEKETSYIYRAYVINEYGISYGVEKSFETYCGEPDAHISNFAIEFSSRTKQGLTWTDSESTVKPWGYMIKWAKDDADIIIAPVDGVVEDANCVYVAQGEEFVVSEGLDFESHYFYKIYPYTNAGTSIDYYTAGVVPMIDGTTLPSGEYLPITSTRGMNCITDFQFNTINNSDARPLEGYNDFTAMSTDLNPGSSYDLTVSFDPGGNYQFCTAVWIDWNHDGWFDNKTEMFDFGETVNKGSHEQVVTVPSDAKVGKTRMRLVYEYKAETPRSFGALSFFSAEDYSINVVNVAPVADAGVAQTVNEGDLVTLDGSASTDANKQELTFAWTSKDGVALTDANTSAPSFTAPAVDADKDYTFELTVSDGSLEHKATVVVTVKNINVAPVADAGAAQTVNEGDVVTLDGSASSDADANTILTYSWTSVQDLDLTGSETAKPSFTAPAVDADKDYTFELTVSDGDLEHKATVVVSVKNVNVAPVADAGVAQTVNEGDVVTLDGSASADADANTTLTYSWTSVEDLDLTGSETAKPSFTAPTVDADKDYTFELTVSDGDLEHKATVVVTVKNVAPVNVAPVADAGVAQTVNEGDVVTLDGTASADADKQELTFAWTSKEGVALTGANTSAPSFTAPAVDADKDYTFELTVSDGALEHKATVVVTVKNVNVEPIADAGEAQTVNVGDVVTLDASASSDADANTTLTYSWTSEDEISIENATQVQASFTAPVVVVDTDFEIKLTVSDGIDESVSTVVITVKGIVTGIEDLDSVIGTVSMYPNPCRDEFKIHLSEHPQDVINIEIYNVTGRIVYQGKMSEQEKTIPVSFVSGLYFVRIRMGETVTVKKLVVK